MIDYYGINFLSDKPGLLKTAQELFWAESSAPNEYGPHVLEQDEGDSDHPCLYLFFLKKKLPQKYRS